MLLTLILGGLALLSLWLMLWQWVLGVRFPLHERHAQPELAPVPVTLLKPLKGCEANTEACLRSWLEQQYQAPVQTLFAVASAKDPVCPVVRNLLSEFCTADAELVICGPLQGANLKVSKLVQLQPRAKHPVLVISDADVRVPPDLLAQIVPLLNSKPAGLVNCFYRLANPSTLALRWEAVAINADFWSQVLQSRALKPLDFALGAVMALRREALAQIGGFTALIDCLADDYQLGNRLARRGYAIAISPLVVECWSEAMGWREVWRHQLRWARTIRVCQPVPYFFSLLSNPTLWPLLWLLANPQPLVLSFTLGVWALRCLMAFDLQKRLMAQSGQTPGAVPPRILHAPLALFKDLLQTLIWALAFLGNRVEWRGEKMRLRRDGTLVKA